MSAAGSAPEIERTLRKQGEAIAALQKWMAAGYEIPVIDAGLISVSQDLLSFRRTLEQVTQALEGFLGRSRLSLTGTEGVDQFDLAADEDTEQTVQVLETDLSPLGGVLFEQIDQFLACLPTARDLDLVDFIERRVGCGHPQAPYVARAVTRYVAGAVLMPFRWLQRKAWVRRVAGFSRPLGTTTVVPGPEIHNRVPAPGATEGGAR